MVLPAKRFCESLDLCFAKKVIDDSIFVRNRLMMLQPTRAVTLSREDFMADAKQIYNIYIRLKFFEKKPSRGTICEKI